MPTSPERSVSNRLLPAPEPQRTAFGVTQQVYWHGGGTGRDPGPSDGTVEGLWTSRMESWSKGFTQAIAPNARRYWKLWRNFADTQNPGPSGDWRDDTVVAEAFKIITNRVPRHVMAQYGGREWAVCEADDPSYEDIVSSVIYSAFNAIGRGSREDKFIARQIEAEIYKEVMGHVWKFLGWRHDTRWLKTRRPTYREDGSISSWEPIETLDRVYDGLSFAWLPLDSLAINLRGPRIWAIERQITSLDNLVSENESYRQEFNQPLYTDEALRALQLVGEQHAEVQNFSSLSEPRDTEHWPQLNDTGEAFGFAPGEKTIELWLCWDNRRRTLTKIAGRQVVIAHGLAPTPDGQDPYWGVKSVIVPNRVYGDSILNWIGGDCKALTRLRRARMDEVYLSLFGQFWYKTGIITSPKLFMRPGGGIGLELPPGESGEHAFGIVPRRDVFQSAYQEQFQLQQNMEITAGADALSMGDQATSKSRDVTRGEVDQRVLQGSARYQVENLYLEVQDKSVMLERGFDLLKQNLTEPINVTVSETGDKKQVTLMDLQQPVNFRIGGGLYEISKGERRRDTAEQIALLANPAVAQATNVRSVLIEWYRSHDYKNPNQFVKSAEEMMANVLPNQNVPGSPPGGLAGPPGLQLPGGGLPELPGAGGTEGGTGGEPSAPASGSDSMVVNL